MVLSDVMDGWFYSLSDESYSDTPRGVCISCPDFGARGRWPILLRAIPQ